MLRASFYSADRSRGQCRTVAALALSALLAGCTSISLDFGGQTAGAQVPTGSIQRAPELRAPLPAQLAASDARMIGRAAANAMESESAEAMDWINAETGSSGTVEFARSGEAAHGRCRAFATTVTSLSGVHAYSGAICRSEDGRAVLDRLAMVAEESA